MLCLSTFLCGISLSRGFFLKSGRVLYKNKAINTLRGGLTSMASMVAEEPKEKLRSDYTIPAYHIESVDLDFILESESKAIVKSKLTVTQGTGPLILDGEDLVLTSIQINGISPEYDVGKDTLTILAPPPAPFTLETVVEIDPKANTQLSGLYVSDGILCTQCEAEGFRRITYFLDRPDIMCKYRVRVEADSKKYPVLLSNGNEIENGDAGNDRHYRIFEDPFKKPCYLFALVAGDLGHIEDTFTTCSGRSVKLAVWSEHHNVKALDWAMFSLKESMRWDEIAYGREYDLDVYHVVAVSSFNMGAMENKGLNVFNTACVLATKDTATDGDFERVLGVIAHEYFHNWSGNRVTCRDWFQLTLKEGLTVFRDQHFSEEKTSAAAKRIEDVRIMRSAQFSQDASPLKHPIRPESVIKQDNFYTVTVYNKGAEIIRMYRTLLGIETFRTAMDLYFDRHDGQAVTCDDFRQAMADASGKDLTQFEEWYKQAGTPLVTVEHSKKDDGSTILKMKQSNDGQPPLVIPIAAATVSSAGTSSEQVFELNQAEQTFELATDDPEAVPSLLRGFSAPIKLIFEPPLTVEQISILAAYDTDPFCKWDAWQQLSTKVIIDRYNAPADKMPELPSYLIDAFKATLADTEAETRLRAYALALPAYSTLALPIDDLDPSKLCNALDMTRKQLAQASSKELEAVYVSLASAATADAVATDTMYSVEAAGARSLRNACLNYMATLDARPVLAHFDAATCMTDKIAAASLLAGLDPSKENMQHVDPKEKDDRIHAFYQTAKANRDDLVINKWFSIQAMANVDSALQNVRDLMNHPDFSAENPNRFRSLINTFAGANPNQFHNALGYEFITEQIIAVDQINPLVAARLASVFANWRRHEPERRELMRQALSRIQETSNISKDTYEIVTRCLK